MTIPKKMYNISLVFISAFLIILCAIIIIQEHSSKSHHHRRQSKAAMLESKKSNLLKPHPLTVTFKVNTIFQILFF